MAKGDLSWAHGRRSETSIQSVFRNPAHSALLSVPCTLSLTPASWEGA